MPIPRPSSLRRASLVAATLAFLASLANAQNFPSHPITVIVPIAAGGSTDVITRLVTKHMSESLGQPIVVENVTGAGGVIGVSKVARAPADGYTLVAGSSGSQASAYSVYAKIPYTPDSFSQIGLAAIIPALIVVNNSIPANNLQEMVAYIKANPGKVSFGNVGVGTSGHLQCEFFKHMTATDIALVPYRGAAPMISDLMSGQIQAACDAMPSSSPAVQSGHIRAIAVLGGERVRSMPEVQTVVEQGMPQLQSSAWVGLSAPKGTPAPVLAALQKALSAALDDPAIQANISKMGAYVPPPNQRGLKYTDDFVLSEVATWSRLAKAANLVKQ
ncbi:MAG: tricarboxylate transport protein [Ramlibacter sp.]|nr:tricarboxylate transport protein [Ramlibacter sp.]